MVAPRTYGLVILVDIAKRFTSECYSTFQVMIHDSLTAGIFGVCPRWQNTEAISLYFLSLEEIAVRSPGYWVENGTEELARVEAGKGMVPGPCGLWNGEKWTDREGGLVQGRRSPWRVVADG